MRDTQQEVATFLEANDLQTSPEYRVLDLASEVGELAKEVNESTEYGRSTADLSVASDEIGDVFFALLAACDSLDIDADEALRESMAKYRDRLDETGTPSSGQ